MAITDNEIVDIELQNPKKRFRINGDNTKIIELNPSDMNIVSRLKEAYSKLNSMANRAGSLLNAKEGDSTEEELENVSSALKTLDKEMRELVDYVFDSPVSDAVASNMNMYSLYNGQFWFEHCIEVLSNLYTNNLKEEFKKMNERMRKHTDKYVGKK